MAVFAYRATDQSGKTVEGRMEAADPGAVAVRLQELNFFPLGIRPAGGGEEESGSPLSLPFRRRDRTVIHFTQQLALLLGAGLPLDRCLAISTDLVEDRQFGRVVEKVRRGVEEGSSLSESLARHPKYFSELYVSMVRAGEASGALDRILTRLAEFLDEWQRIRDVVVTALTYPIFLVCFSAVAVGVIMTVVVPKFALVFADLGPKMPAPTRVLIGVSEFMRHYWWAILAGVAILAATGARMLASPQGREWWHRRVLRIPLAGDLAVKVQVSRFARVLGTLVQGGVPILRALEIVTGTLTNTVFSRSVARVQSGLKEGQGIAEPLRRAGVFPPLFLHMVTVGEETGRMEEMLLTVAATYDRQVESGAKRLLSLLEPIIILFMGILIGSIILSILWAIFSVNQTVF